MPSSNGATYVPDSAESADAVPPQADESAWPRAERNEGGLFAGTRGLLGRGRSNEPGLPGWLAVLILIAICGIGGTIDEVNGGSVRGWFNWSLVISSLVAIVVVKRSQMFSVVVAPPLVYFVASAGMLYIRSHGLKDRTVLINAAANWLVYGFPAIAGATAIVLVVAGVRMIVRR